MKAFIPLRVVLLLFLVTTASGCYATRYAIPSEHAASEYEIIESFRVERRSAWVIAGLVPVYKADVEWIVQREVRKAGGDAATNVVVTSQFDALDVVVAALSSSLFNTRLYVVEGDVVRFTRLQADAGASDTSAEAPRAIVLGNVSYRKATGP